MQLNPFQKEMLRLYLQFHDTGVPRPSMTSRGSLMLISMIFVNAACGTIMCSLSFPILGGAMLGFAFAVAYMVIMRWRWRCKTWLALDHIIDWEKVETLLNKSPENIP